MSPEEFLKPNPNPVYLLEDNMLNTAWRYTQFETKQSVVFVINDVDLSAFNPEKKERRIVTIDFDGVAISTPYDEFIKTHSYLGHFDLVDGEGLMMFQDYVGHSFRDNADQKAK